MKQLMRRSASVLMALLLVLMMMPVLGQDAQAASATINGAPKNLTVTTPAEGETEVTVSWTPNLSCGIDRDSGIMIVASTDGKKTWNEPVDYWDFTLGTGDINYNSYAAKNSCYATLEYGKTYYFKAYYIDSQAQQGPDSNIVGPIVCKEKSSSDSSSSGGSSSDDSSSGDTAPGSSTPSGSGVQKPSLKDVQVSLTSAAAGKITINYIRNASEAYNVYGVQVKYGDKIVLDSDSHNYSESKTITVPYGKKVSLKYRVYRTTSVNAPKKDRVYSSSWKTVSGKCMSLKKPVLSVTKISKDKAGLAWKKIPGATGYKIYKGTKLIKTVKGKTNKIIYSKKGAGSAKYRVRAVIKNSKMSRTVSGPKSAAKKGKPNQRKYSYTTKVKSIPDRSVKYSVSKISVSGNTYTVTGYVLNNRVFDLQKFQKLDFKIYVDGKVVAKKTFRNLKCAVKMGNYKKFTIKIKGKSGVDFANADGTTYSATWEAYWKSVGTWR